MRDVMPSDVLFLREVLDEAAFCRRSLPGYRASPRHALGRIVTRLLVRRYLELSPPR